MLWTLENFSITMKDADHFVKRHNKPVWIVPTTSDYVINIIKPESNTLPFGTCAAEINYVDAHIKFTDNVVTSTQ